jgi:hypothetical protein
VGFNKTRLELVLERTGIQYYWAGKTLGVGGSGISYSPPVKGKVVKYLILEKQMVMQAISSGRTSPLLFTTIFRRFSHYFDPSHLTFDMLSGIGVAS